MSRTIRSTIASAANVLFLAGSVASSLVWLSSCSRGAARPHAAAPLSAAAAQNPSAPAQGESRAEAPERRSKVPAAHPVAAPDPVQAAGSEARGVSNPGKLSAADIQKTMRPNFSAVRACYETALQKNPNLVGRVSVRLTIDENGTVTSAEDAEQPSRPGADRRGAMRSGAWAIRKADPLATGQSVGPMPDAQVVSCVLSAFKKLRFPRSGRGNVTVIYPLIFTPDQ